MEASFPGRREMLRDGAMVFRLNENGNGPELLRQVFIERGWVEFDEEEQREDDWNLHWRTSRFRACDYEGIMPWQRLNHFPKSASITKKDCLARNLKRMKGIYGNGVYNFSPASFNLPNDYTKFVSEYTRLRQTEDPKLVLWICKPADLSRGRGIFLFRDLSDLQYDCSAVVQRYISNPLLIGGYKFDLRIYVLVPCFQPLAIYIYQEGLVRFSTEKFNLGSLNNIFSHLTNTSINKHSPEYTADKERIGPGCKWTITQLRYYFHQSNIDDRMLFARIANIVALTLIMQAPQVPKTNNCFELYGFDILIDENLKPWLLEVNFSPSLNMDCQTDSMVKKPLIHDLLDMMKFKDSDKDRGAVLSPVKSWSQTKQTSQAKQRQSLVSRQKEAGMKPFSHLRLSTGRFGGSSLSLASHNETSYCYEDGNERRTWCLGAGDPATGGGLPIVKDRADIKRQDSDTSGFSSGSSTRTDAKERDSAGSSRSKSSLGFTAKKTKDDPNMPIKGSKIKGHNSETARGINKAKRDSKTSMNSDSATCLSSGSERCASASSSVEEKKNVASVKTTDKPLNGKDKPRRVNSLHPSFSSPVLHKISPEWPTDPKNISDNLFANRENFIPNRNKVNMSGTVFGSFRKSKPQFVAPVLHRAVPNPALSSVPNKLIGSVSSSDASFVNPKSTFEVSKSPRAIPVAFSRTSLASTKSPPKGGPPAQVGDFFLIYPATDGMTKASKPVLDVRTAIQECQKLLKRSLSEIRSGAPQKVLPLSYGVLQPSEQLWGPIRLPETDV